MQLQLQSLFGSMLFGSMRCLALVQQPGSAELSSRGWVLTGSHICLWEEHCWVQTSARATWYPCSGAAQGAPFDRSCMAVVCKSDCVLLRRTLRGICMVRGLLRRTV